MARASLYRHKCDSKNDYKLKQATPALIFYCSVREKLFSEKLNMQEQLEQQTSPGNSIFNNLVDLAPYEKNLKNARIWLFVIAAIQFAVGIFEYFSVDDNIVAAIAFSIDAFVALGFLTLAFWSKKRPLMAFSISLAFYALVIIGYIVIDPSNLFKGIIIKVLVVVALIKAITDAKQYEEVKASIDGNQS